MLNRKPNNERMGLARIRLGKIPPETKEIWLAAAIISEEIRIYLATRT